MGKAFGEDKMVCMKVKVNSDTNCLLNLIGDVSLDMKEYLWYAEMKIGHPCANRAVCKESEMLDFSGVKYTKR